MGGLTGNTFGGIGKKIKKIDPLRGGDVLLEKAGVPTLTGDKEKNILGYTPDVETPSVQSAPTIDDAVVAEDASRALARKRGRQSTVLANTDFNQVSTAKKSLLGG